jgi:hypothetical protein
MASSSALIINRPSVIFDTQGDETVVIDLGTGHYFRLDGPSTRLWQHFEQGVAPDALLAASANRDAFEPEVTRIVAELVTGGLLRPVKDGEPVATEVLPWAFDGFQLEEFTDLEDILGLDPIHEVDTDRGWPYIGQG